LQASRSTTKDVLLNRQLTKLAKDRFCLENKYLLHSPKAIRHDESAILVPAEAIAEDDKEYMVYFYVDSGAFERVRAVMADPEWREFTVALWDVYPGAAGEALTAHGQPLPPAVVQEDGETLRDWALGANSDPVMLVNTLVQVAEVLERLHAHGFVHRDIRPDSMVWLPGQLAWCLVNFGFSSNHRVLPPLQWQTTCIFFFSIRMKLSACI
jgi:serine/threonine protein kinase